MDALPAPVTRACLPWQCLPPPRPSKVYPQDSWDAGAIRHREGLRQHDLRAAAAHPRVPARHCNRGPRAHGTSRRVGVARRCMVMGPPGHGARDLARASLQNVRHVVVAMDAAVDIGRVRSHEELVAYVHQLYRVLEAATKDGGSHDLAWGWQLLGVPGCGEQCAQPGWSLAEAAAPGAFHQELRACNRSAAAGGGSGSSSWQLAAAGSWHMAAGSWQLAAAAAAGIIEQQQRCWGKRGRRCGWRGERRRTRWPAGEQP